MSMQTEVHAKRISNREREGASDQSHDRGGLFFTIGSNSNRSKDGIRLRVANATVGSSSPCRCKLKSTRSALQVVSAKARAINRMVAGTFFTIGSNSNQSKDGVRLRVANATVVSS
jgi:hypothetical protein